MKRIFRVAAVLLIAVLVAALTYAARLVIPGTPSQAASLRYVGFIPLPKGGLVSVLDYLSIYGDNLFVTSESGGTVTRVHIAGTGLPGASDERNFTGAPATHGVVLDPISHLAFVTRSEANTVDVFDPVAMSLVKHIPASDDADGIVYDPQTRLIYVASGDPHIATLIDPATQAVTGSIALGGKPESAVVDPQTHLLYQNLRDTDEIVSVDLAKRTVLDRWKLQGCDQPTGIALDVAGRRLFTACAANSQLVILNIDSHRQLAAMPIGGQPDVLAWDPSLHRIYSAGKAGVTTVVQQQTPDTYRTLDTIHTHYGAHSLIVDPVSHRVYVGYAGLLVAPRIVVMDAVTDAGQ